MWHLFFRVVLLHRSVLENDLLSARYLAIFCRNGWKSFKFKYFTNIWDPNISERHSIAKFHFGVLALIRRLKYDDPRGTTNALDVMIANDCLLLLCKFTLMYNLTYNRRFVHGEGLSNVTITEIDSASNQNLHALYCGFVLHRTSWVVWDDKP